MLATDTGAGTIVRRKPPVANGVVAISIFIATEVMLFSALVSSYLVLRSGAEEWPPWGQPRLPALETAGNTLILLLSGILLWVGYKKFKATELISAKRLLGASIICGLLFVGLQGREWIQLIQYGLTMVSSTYGGLFYLIIGTHALHALVAIIGLIFCYTRVTNTGVKKLDRIDWVVAQLFWLFVVGVWPILYGLVYLT